MLPVGDGSGCVVLRAYLSSAAGEALAKGEVSLGSACGIGVVSQGALVKALAYGVPSVGIMLMQSGCDIFGSADHEDFSARLEAIADTRPIIAEQTCSRTRHLKNAGGRREAKVRHGCAVDIHHHARGAVDAIVQGGGDMTDVADIGGQSTCRPSPRRPRESVDRGRVLRLAETTLPRELHDRAGDCPERLHHTSVQGPARRGDVCQDRGRCTCCSKRARQTRENPGAHAALRHR